MALRAVLRTRARRFRGLRRLCPAPFQQLAPFLAVGIYPGTPDGLAEHRRVVLLLGNDAARSVTGEQARRRLLALHELRPEPRSTVPIAPCRIITRQGLRFAAALEVEVAALRAEDYSDEQCSFRHRRDHRGFHDSQYRGPVHHGILVGPSPGPMRHLWTPNGRRRSISLPTGFPSTGMLLETADESALVDPARDARIVERRARSVVCRSPASSLSTTSPGGGTSRRHP